MTPRVAAWCLLLAAPVAPAQEPAAGPSATDTLTAGLPAEDRPAERPFETDRDAFTPAVTTAGRGRFILETSYTFEDRQRTSEGHSFPELLLRLGVTERVELRLGWNYEVGGIEAVTGEFGPAVDPGGPGLVRESQLLYGLKASVTERDGWVPDSAVILQGFTPTSGPDPASAFAVAAIVGWEFADEWRLDAAVRYARDSEDGDRFGEWAPSAVLRVPVGERWNVHAEYFGVFATDRRENYVRHYFTPGASCRVTLDLELGVRVGWGLNDQSLRFFANAGLGWRY
jgi:hypothetical protein